MPSQKPKLTSSAVYCRIRPFATSGGHADVADGEIPDQKTLDGWDEGSVTIATEYSFSKGNACYSFPRTVFPPESTQHEVYDRSMPPLVNRFCGCETGDTVGAASASASASGPSGGGEGVQNVLFLAYGQTGTGKTHTMFGTDESLRSGQGGVHAGWGLFPRVAHAVFSSMRGENRPFILSGQAVEFYCCSAFDLLSTSESGAPTGAAKRPVFLDGATQMPRGCVSRNLESMEDVLTFIDTVRKNRTSRSTRMNQSGGGHEGSSRSHATLILYLLQKNPSTEKIQRSFFALVDLAGAERPSKTGEQRKSGFEAMVEIIQGKPSLGAEAAFINYELTLMRSAIVAASGCHTQGKRYAAETASTTALIKFLSGAFTGKALLGMVVTLSPSGKNGWETWFSLEYGKDMATLKVPLGPGNLGEACGKVASQWEAAACKAYKDWEATPASGAPSSKYYAVRLSAAILAAQLVVDLQQLTRDSSGSGGEAEARLEKLMKMDRATFEKAMTAWNFDSAKK